LYNDELHNLYPSPSIVTVIKPRRMEWAVYAARIGEMRKGWNTSVWVSEKKTPLWGTWREWKDNIKRI